MDKEGAHDGQLELNPASPSPSPHVPNLVLGSSGSFQQLQTQYPEGYIPEPPPIPIAETVETVTNALGEPTLHSLGLASWWHPVGWYQNLLEWVHVSLDMPWWQCILASKFRPHHTENQMRHVHQDILTSLLLCLHTGVVLIRILTLPVIVMNMKTSIRIGNNSPKHRRAMERYQEAMAAGNMIEGM